MPTSDFTTNFKFALSTNEDFSWGNDFRSNLDSSDKNLKELQDLAANFTSMLQNHLISTDHNWRYYTKDQLSNGQLNSLYHTETELDGGILDTRYTPIANTYNKTDVYSKSEMDSLFAKKEYFVSGSLISTLDGKYFTKSQIDGGILDTYFYTKSQGDALINAQKNVELNNFTIAGVNDHIMKFQIKATGEVDLFDSRDPNAQRVVSPLESTAVNINNYATLDSTFTLKKQTVGIVNRYGYALNYFYGTRIGFPAGYSCQFSISPGKFVTPTGGFVDSVWIPVSVNEINSSFSSITRLGGSMISILGANLKSAYITSDTYLPIL